MSIVPRKNPNDLTDEETAFLRTSGVHDEVREYLKRQHDNVGTKISAYRKVAAAARAESEALLAVRELEAIHGELTEVAAAREVIASLKRRTDALEARVSSQALELERSTAESALAVHSSD